MEPQNPEPYAILRKKNKIEEITLFASKPFHKPMVIKMA